MHPTIDLLRRVAGHASGFAPATRGPHCQLDVELPADQVADREATPQGRSDPQVFRIVLIDQVLDVAGLLMGEENSPSRGGVRGAAWKRASSPRSA